jgi:transposase
MAKPYSEDLRTRVVAAVDGGLSRRQTAKLFDLGISSVIRWVQRARATGSAAAKPMGGDHRSRLTGERDWILARVEATPDVTIEELREELRGRGTVVGYGTVWRFLAREKLTFKKNGARGRARAARRGRGASGMEGRAAVA